MNAQFGCRSDKVSIISFQDLGDKASFKMLRSLREEDASFNHIATDVFQPLLKPERLF
jgi:hypothetical protein